MDANQPKNLLLKLIGNSIILSSFISLIIGVLGIISLCFTILSVRPGVSMKFKPSSITFILGLPNCLIQLEIVLGLNPKCA